MLSLPALPPKYRKKAWFTSFQTGNNAENGDFKMKKNIKDMNREELLGVLRALETKQAKGKALTALETFQIEIIPVMIEQQEKREELEKRVKTTKKSPARQTKALTDEETLLFPLVKAVYRHEKAKEVINHAAKLVKITINSAMVEAWVRASIRHNSHSNIAKLADSKGKAYNYEHFSEMLSTFATLLKSFDKATGEMLSDSVKLTLFDEVESNSGMKIKHEDVTAAKDILDIAYAVAE